MNVKIMETQASIIIWQLHKTFPLLPEEKSDYDRSLNTSLKLAGAAYALEGNSGWMVAEHGADIIAMHDYQRVF